MNSPNALSKWATSANFALTSAGLLVMAVGIVNTYALPRTDTPHPVLDYLEAAILWSYIVVTPVCAATALLLARPRSGWVRINYWLLALWAGFMAWTGTMSL